MGRDLSRTYSARRAKEPDAGSQVRELGIGIPVDFDILTVFFSGLHNDSLSKYLGHASGTWDKRHKREVAG